MLAYHVLCNYVEEQHPWPPYIPEGATKLLLGTFPTANDNRRFEFYYPSPKNRFWAVISSLAEKNLEHFTSDRAISERQEILKDLKLAISDMGQRILRQQDSALDHNLFPLEFCDVFALIEANTNLNTIILTSSGKGNSALSWFSAYCELNFIQLAKRDEKIPWETFIQIGSRKVKVVVAYSTSSSYWKLNVSELIEHYRPIITT